MQRSFYFYDLETSGLNARTDRIMQFAGQRTDMNLRPIGEPTNLLVRLPEDTLPSPGAIMVTGITPQATQADGISERELCEFLIEQVATPGTTIVGYNSIRFDDEFVRHTLWRNFYDPYEWEWKDGRSRWDLLDVVRLTRALRPEGINWPLTEDGHATNRLELLTKENNISHEHAHDALADVDALIAVTGLIRDKQPQLFNYLYSLRDKRAVAKLVNPQKPEPFVYASGRYAADFEKTTVAYPFGKDKNGNVLVYDLRYNVNELLEAEKDGTYLEKFGPKPGSGRASQRRGDSSKVTFFPMVKTLQYNRCPAVAPLGVLDKGDGWEKIHLSKGQINQNLANFLQHPDFAQRMLREALARPPFPPGEDPESALYEGFLVEHDKLLCAAVRNNSTEDLRHFRPKFQDARLGELMLHYKARNFGESLDADEAQRWEEYRCARLKRQAPKFLADLQTIQKDLAMDKTFGNKSPEECAFLAEELKLWYESLQPDDY